jgi:hypothetical protein
MYNIEELSGYENYDLISEWTIFGIYRRLKASGYEHLRI